MSIETRPYSPGDFELLRSLCTDASLAGEFERLQGPHGLEDALRDPFARHRLDTLGSVAGDAAGFCLPLVLPGREGSWVLPVIGVIERHRRKGLGSALLERALAGVREEAPECREACLATWLPSPAAVGFATRHGFRHERYFWLMERPREEIPEVVWPPGIEVRVFDQTDAAFEDWNAAYNLSFADHYRRVTVTVKAFRTMAARKGFDPSGLILAYNGGRCVGFCRNDLHEGRGEIGVLGVIPQARGIGLGRALLRWGIAWLDRAGAPRHTLAVDGENDNALRLYRSEGFTTVRTRETWSRAME